MARPSKTLLTLSPLFLVLIIDAMGFGIVFPLLGPLFLSPEHSMLSPTTSVPMRNFLYGLSLTSFFIFMFFGSPFFGDLSDKYGRKRVILICLFGTGLSYMICIAGMTLNSIFLFLFGRCLAGFLAGSQSIAQAAIIDISTPENKTSNLALITLAGCLGFAIGPLVGGLFSSDTLIAWANEQTPFLIAASLAFINFIGLWFLFHETHAVKHHAKIYFSKAIHLLIEAIQVPEIRRFSVVFFLMQLAWGLYYQYISLFLVQTLFYDGMKIGLFNTYLGALFSLSLVVFIRLLLRFLTPHRLTFWALLVLAVGCVANIIFPYEIAYWIILSFVTISVGVSYTCLLTLFSDAAPPERQGWVMGISEAMFAIAWVIGSLFISSVAFLPANTLFITGCVLALLGMWVMRKAQSPSATA